MGDDTDQTELPVGIATAWGVRDRPARGPRPGLSVERIVEAAIATAQDEGLAAVSMNRVAARLGTAAMSLYRYVSSKDELIALMADEASGAPPDVSDDHWRTALSDWARAQLDAYRAHPWLAHVPIGGPPIMPNGVAWFDRGLRCFAGTGLAEDEKIGVVLLVTSMVRIHATLEAQLAAAMQAEGAGGLMSGYAQMLRLLTDPERFPGLHGALTSGVLEEDDGSVDFDFGLEIVLDGIAVLVNDRATPSHR